MWMGELITNRGIGNGMSLIIFCSVVSSLPSAFSAVYGAENGTVKLSIFIAFFLVMLGFIVFIELGQRRIPVQFAKRVVGRRMYSGQSTYIPLKVNQAGVVPIIFASAVINLPVLLSQVLPSDGWGATVSELDQRQPRQHDQPDLPDLPRSAHRRVRVLLHGDRVRSRSSRPTTCASRVGSSRASVRAPDRVVPVEGAQPDHAAGRDLHRDPGHRPDDPASIPARCQRLRDGQYVRRHVAAHRRRRRPRDDEAGRQPADDAQLRRVPLFEVSGGGQAPGRLPVGITRAL